MKICNVPPNGSVYSEELLNFPIFQEEGIFIVSNLKNLK